jgi:hypothetical protein
MNDNNNIERHCELNFKRLTAQSHCEVKDRKAPSSVQEPPFRISCTADTLPVRDRNPLPARRSASEHPGP